MSPLHASQTLHFVFRFKSLGVNCPGFFASEVLEEVQKTPENGARALALQGQDFPFNLPHSKG